MISEFAEASPQRLARIAAAFYVITFAGGITALLVRSPIGSAAGLLATVSYIAVTVLFYYLFRPVSRNISLAAAVISLIGCVIGPVSMAVKAAGVINPLVFFGFYCSLIGYLILKSSYLPHFLGVLMLAAGLGWLTFLAPSFAKSLYPYNMFPGILGEGSLTLWLLFAAVDSDGWRRQRLNVVTG